MTIRPLVVIPLYNHAGTVRQVAEGVLQRHPNLLVVDDGSSDEGAAVLDGLPLTVVSHPENRGKGRAIQTAMNWAAENGFTHLLTLDADGQHDPADMANFLPEIGRYPDDILVGMRDFNTENVPGSSVFGRKFSNFWLRVQTGKSLGDTQSGYRVYPVWVLQNLPLKSAWYTFEIEVLVRAAWAGIRLRDVPVSVYYPPEEERVSHFHKVRDNARLTLLNTKLTMRSVLPWPHRKLVEDEATGEKISVLHPMRSLRTLLTENSSPSELSAAVMLGIFLGTLPLIAMHTISILFAASFFRLNKAAAVAASQLTMPPLVPALCIEAGYFLRNGRFLTEVSLETLGYQALDRIMDWMLGSLLVGPFLAAVFGLLVYLTASSMVRDDCGTGK